MCEQFYLICGKNKQEISLKKIFGYISIVEFVLYVLIFVVQCHPTWETISNTLTMPKYAYTLTFINVVF